MQTEIRSLNLEQMSEIYEKYMTEAFPKEELKPFHRIADMSRQQIYMGYGLFADDAESIDDILAYGFYVRNPKSGDLLLDYLAVPDEMRNLGYGSVYLSHLQEMMSETTQTVLIEIENPKKAEDEQVKALRESRMNFYLRNGIQLSKVESNVFTVEYLILQYNQNGIQLDDETVYQKLDALYRQMFPEDWIGDKAKIYPLS